MSVYASLDSAVGAFAGSIEFYWKQPNDPIVEARNISMLARQLNDLTPVLEGAREIVIADVEAHFHEERGPNGEEWQEWAPSYAPVAARENIGKLRRRDSQKLYEAATDHSAYEITENDMFIDTSGFPIYWAIQQYGGLIMSGKTLIRRHTMRRRGEPAASDHGRIPPRPYLGTSAEAAAAIIDLFDNFLTGEIIRFEENPLRGPGAMQPRLRSGRYGKIPTV